MDESPRDYLFDRIDYERRSLRRSLIKEFDLSTMNRLVENLGNPHNAFPIVHVAGTKGKGSTSTMIAEMLQTAGLKTGLYTSPHLDRLEERFQVDGEAIETSKLDQLIGEVRTTIEEIDTVEKLDESLRAPTFFEITTALAFLYFQRSSVDVAVIEVGLGGRLDSTNVCQPILSLITNIGFDHTQILGNTLAKIAAEKAGIIKNGVPVIWGGGEPEASEVIRRVAGERKSPLFEYGRDFGIDTSPHPSEAYVDASDSKLSSIQSPRVAENYWSCERLGAKSMAQLTVGMAGRHQQANAALAIAAVNLLQQSGWRIDDESITSGLATARIPGRIEYSKLEPRLVIDVAHNVPSMQALIDTLNEDLPEGPRVLVLGLTRDKDLAGILELVIDHFDRIVITRYLGNPRAADPSKLSELLSTIIEGRPGSRLKPESMVVSDSPRDAARAVVESARPNEWTVVAGSVFIAAEYASCLRDQKHEAVV